MSCHADQLYLDFTLLMCLHCPGYSGNLILNWYYMYFNGGNLLETVCIREWYIANFSASLFQTLCHCGRLKKRVGDERGLVEKEGTMGEPVSIALKTSFRYTSFWYTL